MNQTRMRKSHYSLDAKNIVARMRNVLCKTIRQISFHTGIPKSTVHRWVQMHPATRKRRSVNHTKWSVGVGDIISETLLNNPFCPVHELLSKLCSQGVNCRSSSTVSRWIRKNVGMTHKRVSGKYVVHNENVHDRSLAFRGELACINMADVVSVDETSIYFSENSKYGYTPKGIPLKHRVQPSRKYIHRRLTLVLAISSERIVHFKLMEGSCNSEKFCDFVHELPNDCPQHVLMDNVAFHKTKQVQRVMESRGLNPLFVPPYSPQYNPIENVFAVVKGRLRRRVDSSDNLLYDDVGEVLTSSLRSDVLWNSFAHAWELAGKIR